MRVQDWLTVVCLIAVLEFVGGCDGRSPSRPTPTPAPTTLELSGTVVEIGAGPVAGATVSAVNCAVHTHVFGQTVTDASGAFRISKLPIGCVSLGAEKSGYEREEPREPAEGNENITLRLQRLRRATGRVVEVDGGSAVPSVEVSTHRSARAAAAVSDANGFFVINGVGRLFYLDKRGFALRSVEVPEGQDVDLGPVRLQRAIEISAGASLTSQISSRDVYYGDFYVMGDDGVFCSPCKSIDLQTRQQDLEIRLQWSGPIPLALWAATPYRGI